MMQAAIPVLVEESCSKRDSLHNKLQVLDALALLFESHGAAVVDVDNDVVKSESGIVSYVSQWKSSTLLFT